MSFPSSRCQNKITTERRKGKRVGLIYFNVLKPEWFLLVLLGWEPGLIISLLAEHAELPVHALAPSLFRNLITKVNAPKKNTISSFDRNTSDAMTPFSFFPSFFKYMPVNGWWPWQRN